MEIVSQIADMLQRGNAGGLVTLATRSSAAAAPPRAVCAVLSGRDPRGYQPRGERAGAPGRLRPRSCPGAAGARQRSNGSSSQVPRAGQRR